MSAEQDKIKDIAYQLWQDAGSPHGRDQEFWYAAEAQVTAAKPAKPKAAPKAEAKPAKPKAEVKPAKPKAEVKPAKPKAEVKPKAPAKAKAATKV